MKWNHESNDPAQDTFAMSEAEEAYGLKIWHEISLQADDARTDAIDVLHQLEHPAALYVYAQALKDAHWEVRTAAVQALGDLRHNKVPVLLLDVLLNEDDDMVKQSIIRALGKCKVTRAIPLIIRILESNEQNWLVREAAAWSLGNFGPDAPVEVLIKTLLRDSDEIVQAAAAKALGTLRVRRAEKALLGALRHESEEVHDAAEEAIQAIYQEDMTIPQWQKVWIHEYKEADPMRVLALLSEREEMRASYGEGKDYRQLLLGQTFRLLSSLLTDKQGRVSDPVEIPPNSEWHSTLLTRYCYVRTSKILSEEVLPLVRTKTPVPVRSMQTVEDLRGDSKLNEEVTQKVIEYVKGMQGRAGQQEILIVALDVACSEEETTQLVYCGIGCERISENNGLILPQIHEKWQRRLKSTNILAFLDNIKHLQIWYQPDLTASPDLASIGLGGPL